MNACSFQWVSVVLDVPAEGELVFGTQTSVTDLVGPLRAQVP